MYHPDLIAARAETAERVWGRSLPGGKLGRYTVRDSATLTASAMAALDEHGTFRRALTEEEQHFIATARLRTAFDFPWFASRFCWIDKEGSGLRRLAPFWESQQLVLDQLARLELQREKDGWADGLLLNILKARQLGVSTLSEALLAHRICTRTHIRALSGADVEDQAGYLFRMVVRIYDQLPWFLKPGRVYFNKNRELSLSNQSFLKTAWGKSTRGALQAVSGQEGNKGSIGRGQTFSVVHISELPTWENPEQLDTALLPAIPYGPDTLVLYEATAEFAGDWWHKHWLTSGAGEGRFRNVFIPWSAEPSKYALPPPEGWTPAPSTLAHAEKCERDSPKWFGGRTIRLAREQLYWYETTRRFYEAKGQLFKFLKEYPADDEECVAGDTRVCTEQGLIPIDQAQQVQRVESGAVSQWWDRGERPTLKLRTRAGRELVATPEHLIARSDGVWVTLSDLRAGDVITLTPPQFLVQTYYRACWRWAPACEMATIVTEDVARLIGFFLGDGSWVDGGIDIACCARDGDVIAEVSRLIEQIIGRAPTYKHKGGYVGVRSPHKRWWEICWGLGLLTRREEGSFHKRLRVPECIWRSPRAVVAAFLSGLFESDGHANRQGPQTSFFTKSEDLIREIQLLLLGFGINAEYRTATKRTRGQVYTGRCLRLNARNTVIFHEAIGFVGQWKRSQPHQLASRRGGGRPAAPLTLTDVVASVEAEGMRKVYDLGVEPTHYFGAAGITAHNCFQYAGRSVFTFVQLDAIEKAGTVRKLLDVWAVEPAVEIAALRRDPAAASADLQPKRVVPPLAPHQPGAAGKLAHDLHPVPPGYGFRRLTAEQLGAIPNLRQSVLAIWEYPRVRGPRRYILSVDVSDGLGQDYSIIDVIRQPTIEEPAEEVAQYCTNKLDPKALAFVCDAIGRYYSDPDGIEAMAAIETNNHGLATQDTLQLHLGYAHFYVWEYADAATPERRYSTRIGWLTSPRTRPLLLASFYGAVTATDAVTSQPDFVLNSPVTRGELRHFLTETTIGEAEAARGQHDDAIMAAAIGYYVAWRMAGGEIEPIAERRRRRSAQRAQEVLTASRPAEYRNMPATVEEADDLETDHEDDVREEFYQLGADPADLYFDDRSRA